MIPRVLVIIELVLLALSLVFAALWIGDPKGNYEPYTLAFAVLLGFLDVGRRRLERTERSNSTLGSIIKRLATHRCLYDDWCRQMPKEVALSVTGLHRATRDDLVKLTSDGASNSVVSQTQNLVEALGSYLTSWEKISKNEVEPNHNSIGVELMRLRAAVATYIREVSPKIGIKLDGGVDRILDASREAEAWLQSVSQDGREQKSEVPAPSLRSQPVLNTKARTPPNGQRTDVRRPHG